MQRIRMYRIRAFDGEMLDHTQRAVSLQTSGLGKDLDQ